MPDVSARRRQHVVTCTILALLITAVCLPVWPGIFTIDSQAILGAARGNEISDWYSPLHGWLWAQLDRMGLPVGGFFLFGVTAFVAALYLVCGQLLPRRAALATTAAVTLWPPVYGLLGWVGRDVWFACYFLAIVGLSIRLGAARAPTGAAHVGALVLVSIAAADARQNGLPLAALGIIVATVSLARRVRPAAGRRDFVVASAASCVGVLLITSLLQNAVQSVDHHPGQVLLLRDLVDVSLKLDRAMLDMTTFPSQDLDLVREQLNGTDPATVIRFQPPLVRYDPYQKGDAVNAALSAQWRRMVLHHPVTYVWSRADLYAELVGISGNPRSPYFILSDDLTDEPSEFDQQFTPLASARADVLGWFAGPPGPRSWLHLPVFYAAATLGATFSIARRTRQWAQAWVFVGVVIVMQAMTFVAVPTPEFRFQYYLVVLGTTLAAIAGLLELQARVFSAGSRRRRGRRRDRSSRRRCGP